MKVATIDGAQGGCLCGAVRYKIAQQPKSLVHCHCKDCRRAAGAPSVAWMILPAEGVRWISGEPRTVESSPGVMRGFCSNCGTSLTYRETSSRYIDVTTATLDEPSDLAPIKEIWVEQRLAWDVLDESLPHFARSSIGKEPIN